MADAAPKRIVIWGPASGRMVIAEIVGIRASNSSASASVIRTSVGRDVGEIRGLAELSASSPPTTSTP